MSHIGESLNDARSVSRRRVFFLTEEGRRIPLRHRKSTPAFAGE